MIESQDIVNAYIFLRENNHTIPSEVLEFMLRSSLDKLSELSNG